jgi:hypothetical protein
LLALLGLAQFLFAGQQHTAPREVQRKGSVSGKVFLITQSGDLKVARLAKVYLLWSRTLPPLPDPGQGPAERYSRDRLDAVGKVIDRSREIPAEAYSEHLECLERLHVASAALLRILDWAITEKKPYQVLVQDTDEEQGSFRFDGVRPGLYMLVAEGQAGMNRAYWEAHESIKVLPGQTATVKLSSPSESCLVAEE